MKVKIAKWGSSLAVRLPKALAQDTRLAEGQIVELTATAAGTLELRSSTPIPRYTLAELLAQIEPGTEPPPFEDWSKAEVAWPDDDWSDIVPSDEEMGVKGRHGNQKGS